MASPPPSSRQDHVFQAPTGTRDFYPAELNRLRYIQDAWRRTSISHGFDEIDGPTFEHLDLYTVKSGEGIVSELFSFERFGGEKKFALRPEFTPTLARMYASKAGSLPKPTKWFWMQNCFRAERPQRGRLREFCQWNCDIIGDDSAAADVEVLACCIGMFQALGLRSTDVRVRVNDRGVVAGILEQSGVKAERVGEALSLLDRRAKIDAPEFAKIATAIGLDVKRYDGALAAYVDVAPSYKRLRDDLNSAGIGDWVAWDFGIVRGLAYYTGMVFEVHEASSAERAIAGGGRYDKLIEMFGGPPTPAVGFGMGDVVLSLVLQDKGLMPSDDEIAGRLGLRPDVFVISNGTPEADAAVVPTLAGLRREGLHARRSYKSSKNIGKLLGDATKARARFALIIESGTAGQIKDLDENTQVKIELAHVAELLRSEK
ncbi:MAG: histidine--tRNA ligase [Phycisphaerales bacterium]|nr:histidine--tRNA ligase [Phycisphaerales bacterium]